MQFAGLEKPGWSAHRIRVTRTPVDSVIPILRRYLAGSGWQQTELPHLFQHSAPSPSAVFL